jgi:hypothetical protein
MSACVKNVGAVVADTLSEEGSLTVTKYAIKLQFLVDSTRSTAFSLEDG